MAFFVTPSVDYYDPYAFLNLFFESRFIGRTNSSNLRSPKYDRRLRAASRLRGKPRLQRTGGSTSELARDVAPIAPLTYIASRRSSRSGSAASCCGRRSTSPTACLKLALRATGPTPRRIRRRTAIPDGALPTSIVSTSRSVVGVDTRDGSVAAVRDPDRPRADRDGSWARLRRESSRSSGRRARIDPGDGVGAGVRDPDRAFAGRDRGRPQAHARRCPERPLLERLGLVALHGRAVGVHDPDVAALRPRLPQAPRRRRPSR